MSPVPAGLLASVPLLAGGALQLLDPRAIQRARSLRAWVAMCAAVQALAFVPLVVLALSGRPSTGVIFAAASLYWAAGMAASAGWTPWMARVVPARVRSRFFGRRQGVMQSSMLLGLLLHRGVLGDLLRGVFDALRGALYLITHPRLWKFVLAPLVAAVVLLAAVIGSGVSLLHRPIEALAAHLPGSWADDVLQLLAGVILVIGSVVIFVSVASLVAGPFNEMLSESIEEHETGVASPPFRLTTFLRDLVVGIAHAVRRVAVYLVVMIALLVVGVAVPVVGTVIATVLGAIATARFASYDAYDAVWSRRRLRYREKMAAMREDRWRTLGLGATTAVLLVVPGLNIIGLAIGATGATLRRVSEVQVRAKRDVSSA
jgi:uncharacterized protein involved in cysteine biosynthesis